MQLTYIARWKFFSPPRIVLTGWISKNGSTLCGNQSPFSPLIPLKAFLEIDYTESLPALWITVAQFQSHFLQSKDMGILFYYAARCKACSRNFRDHPFVRIILCADSRTSVWALGFRLALADKRYHPCRSLSRSVFTADEIYVCFFFFLRENRKQLCKRKGFGFFFLLFLFFFFF